MKTASYTDTRTATGGVGKYPLSTETLDFIQDQIKLLELLAGVGGSNYILKAPDGTNAGVAVIVNADKQTEVVEIHPLPVFGTSVKYLTVTTTAEDIKADAETYKEARILRVAQFTTAKGAESYDINSFANVNGKQLEAFPTNAVLAAQIKNMPQTVLTYLKDVLAEKLTAKTVQGLTQTQLDGLKTPCVLSCTASVSLFGFADYTVIVTAQGRTMVRQELIQGQDCHYVRTWNGATWGVWCQQTETAMHLDVKIVGTKVYLRHGTLGADCDIVLLRKKKRSAYRRTGGAQSYTKNKGKRQKRQPKSQYVHFKGVRLSKGTPGKWYVPKCIGVADPKTDSNLIGKELPTLCASLFYVGHGGFYRMQGSRKKIVLKSTTNSKGTCHKAYAPIGVQIARLKATGGKDSGGEIVRMKYRVSQRRTKSASGVISYGWLRSFSLE
ncbi:hypothetical protein [Xylanibacter rodentium]|jgi:hypothetical protein|uniref:hypothetical protein n=1 Tax=Xylanibacter rodentium TaxID=2736289 RepID=UPI002598C78A|nr:hypothetical protein [Xylanibacter rodentium]